MMELSPPNTVSTAKCPLNVDDRVTMDLRWLHLVNLHKFAVQQIESQHRIDAWEVYFNALEKWREKYMDEPVARRRSPAGAGQGAGARPEGQSAYHRRQARSAKP
jgi:hypothetical protein